MKTCRVGRVEEARSPVRTDRHLAAPRRSAARGIMIAMPIALVLWGVIALAL
jgi:hypothetical protein